MLLLICYNRLSEKESDYMRFLTIERDDENSVKVSKELIQKCENIGWKYSESDPEVILSVGGDGTLLRGIHDYIDKLDSLYFVGIHTGTLGFYTDYTQTEIDQFILDIQKNQMTYENMPLLEVYLPEIRETFYALNEVRLVSPSRTVQMDVYIDDEYFEHCTGSGLCISTQAGSTAINRALQGAVIDNGLQVLQLCEIMPISHHMHHSLRSPYIMKADRVIRIHSRNLDYVNMCYDHKEHPLKDIHEVIIRTSLKKARFARYKPYSYLKRIKNLY